MNQDFYIEYIQKELLGTISAEERQQLQKWKAQSADNQLIADRILKAWDQSEAFGDDIFIDLDVDYQLLQDKIRQSEKGSIFTLNTWMGLAASVAVLFGIVFLLRPSTHMEIVADSDKFEIILPDGSEAILSKGTEINYSKNFDSERIVELEGGALFKVIHDKDLPFEVRSTHLTTTVLGTTFFIIDKEESGDAEVQLLEGSVSVSNATGQSVILKENQRVILQENEELLLLDQLKTQQFDWYYDGFQFDNSSLDQVIQDIANYYGVYVQLNEELRRCSFTGNLQNQSLDVMLSSIAEVYGSDLIKTKDGYTIANGQCR